MSAEEPRDDESAKGEAKRRKHRWSTLVAVIVVALAVYLVLVYLASRKPVKKPPPPRVPVVAAAAVRKDVDVFISGLGSVTPLNTVVVKTRVDGELMEVLFREGGIVRGGDLLAKIDPRPFQVQLTQAEGQLARDTALLQNARVDLERYKVLWDQNSIQKQQLDTQESLVKQLEGAVKTDQGQIDSAKLQLYYCRIISPIRGRVGLRTVDPGNIVHATDTNGIVVITQLQPISVIFPVPEDNLPKVLSGLGSGEKLPVEAYDRDLRRRLATGYLSTADNEIDPTTGTVKLKAIFSNSDYSLFPNQFVNARLRVEVLHNATVVPAASVQRGPQGPFVYVVKPDQTASIRFVEPGVTEGADAVITRGISSGELVVVEGAERLREGARVEVKGGGPKKGA